MKNIDSLLFPSLFFKILFGGGAFEDCSKPFSRMSYSNSDPHQNHGPFFSVFKDLYSAASSKSQMSE